MKFKFKNYIMMIVLIICLGCQKRAKDTIQLIDTLNENIATSNTPGLAVSIIKKDSILFQRGFGKASLENETPMTPEGILNVASISKTIVATAIMQLWEQGLIDLNANVNLYLPFSIANPHFSETPITVLQLLTHTSSIYDSSVYQNSYICGDSSVALENWMISYFKIGEEKDNVFTCFLKEEPGATYNYSNVGYGLLALLVEKISKTPFNLYCKTHIFKPLNMEDTGWFLDEIDNQDLITPYLYISEEQKDSVPENFNKLFRNKEIKANANNPLCTYGFPNYPDGQLRTSVADLSKFLIAMINGGKYLDQQILKASTIKMMLTPQIIDNDKQGICWRYTGMEAIWGHGGDDPGVQSGIYFNPELAIGVICLKNNNEGSRTKILKELYLTAKDL